MTERSDNILTETLADLYLKHGMKNRARKILEQLLESDPQNVRIREKLFLLRSSSREGPERSQDELEEDLISGDKNKEGHDRYDGPSDNSAESLNFEKLNTMYREMARQKNEKKIRMLKKMLENFAR